MKDSAVSQSAPALHGADSHAEPSGPEKFFQTRTRDERTVPTTCIETIGGDPNTALRLSFQIKVF